MCLSNVLLLLSYYNTIFLLLLYYILLSSFVMHILHFSNTFIIGTSSRICTGTRLVNIIFFRKSNLILFRQISSCSGFRERCLIIYFGCRSSTLKIMRCFKNNLYIIIWRWRTVQYVKFFFYIDLYTILGTIDNRYALTM